MSTIVSESSKKQRNETAPSLPSQPPGLKHSQVQLAIVGCGPRGLQCLDALSRTLGSHELRRVCISLFDPAEFPGAGSIYDPRQPHELRMNFAAHHIDFGNCGTHAPRLDEPPLVDWLTDRYPEYAAQDAYVPRAIVGEYLHDCFNHVRKRIEAVTTLRIVREPVLDMTWSEGKWRIGTATLEQSFDEVVITTGHEGFRCSGELPEVPGSYGAFPVDNLSLDRVPQGSQVLVRGFGLTALDAVLSLSEGRGGSFESTGEIPRYISGANEPARIDIVSRSGRPMLAKPEAEVGSMSHAGWAPFRERLKHLALRHGELHFRHDIWPILCDAAAAAIQDQGQPQTSLDVENWWRSWSRYKMSRCDAGRAMLQSYAVATSKRPPDVAWALGEAWRQLFPQLVDLVSYGGLAAEDWPAFQLTAREMERIAFGPSASTVGKFLALIRCGLVNLVCSVDSRQQDERPAYDAVVDAVTAGPRELIPQGPLAILLESGQLQRDEVSGALKVDSTGRPLGNAAGLAVFGRATEGWVLGNDSLSRTLHPNIFSWARSIQILARKVHA